MELSLFLEYRSPCEEAAPLDEFRSCLGRVPGLKRAVLHQPTDASDPYLKAEGPPSLVLQCYFEGLPALENASGSEGALHPLLDRGAFRWLADAEMSQQAMVVRTASPFVEKATPHAVCTYLVGYAGVPRDYDAWLGHYLSRHVPLMKRLPGLRELEIYTRLDWITTLPARRETFVQRNKVVFDSPAALTEALHSPVRYEMRRDYEASPPFDGHNVHFPMFSTVIPSHCPLALPKESQ